ncbi:MAG: ABC transporter ATP-binding protein [Candidatus Aminicenantia bacterium]
MKEFLKLCSLLFLYWKRILLAFVSMIMVSIFTSISALLIQPVVDHLFIRQKGLVKILPVISGDFLLRLLSIKKESYTIYLPVLIIIVFFFKFIFRYISSYNMNAVGVFVSRDLRDKLYSHIINQSANFFSSKPTGELISRVTNDIDKIQFALSETVGDLIRESFTLLGLLIVIFYQDQTLALFSILLLPFSLVPIISLSKKMKKQGMIGQKKMSEISNILLETISGNFVVKAFNREKKEELKFREKTEEYMNVSKKIAKIVNFASPFMEFLGGVAAAIIIYLGTHRISKGIISPGQFTTFLSSLILMYTPIKILSKVNFNIQQALVGLERFQEILSIEPEVKDKPGAKPFPPFKGEVEFRNVSFGYGDEAKILKNVSFQVKPGEMVAIVGLSGAGKTTLINLILRFYDVQEGMILIDGMDIRDGRIESLRAQIGLVPQDIILFNDTIKNNIAYGVNGISENKIIEAAHISMSHDFIEKLPNGYTSIAGERGQLLSLGQRQRIAIARAIIKDPPILIMDEATSQLDSESETAIQKAMENLIKNRTTIVIAHRLSTVRKAHKILVLDKGKIVESGTHNELLKRGGLYAHLYALQFPDLKE